MRKSILPILLMAAFAQPLICVANSAPATVERPANWATLIDKEHNLYQVSPLLYRSEQPISSQTQQLQQLGISTIITLRSRNKTQKEFSGGPFKVIHIPINTWDISRDDVLTTMRQLRDAEQEQKKVLIHCYHGSDRTGTMVAMYRIFFENWKVDDAVHEMKQGGYGFHSIWKNIDALFSNENISWVQENLDTD